MWEPSSAEDGGDGGQLPAVVHQKTDTTVSSLPELRQIPVDRITTPRRPARRFLGDIGSLAESMHDFGLQQPISVRADGDRFILTSGMRRVAAAQMLHWETIPGFVRNISADQAYVLDLIENLQRQDLSAEEEADALGELIRARAWTLQQVADTIKRSVGYVSKRIRLFEDALLRDAVAQRGMPVSTAEELLAAAPEQRNRLVEQAIAERWDQVRARDALRPAMPPLLEHDSDIVTPTLRVRIRNNSTAEHSPAGALRPSVRPRGFTRAIRDFHRLIGELDADDLNSSDRAALRALFRDLLFLARASAAPATTVFPPLPPPPARLASKSRTKSHRSR